VIGLNVVYILMLQNMRGFKSVLVAVRGHSLVQFKGSRVPLLGNVYVHKPCVKHRYENKSVCY
jgi:hypothetical protein